MTRPGALRTGGRSELLSRPSARSEAGSRSFRPCWYWMPMASQPNSSAMRRAAMYVLHCQSTWFSVSSVASSVPRWNFMPLVEQPLVDRARLGFAHLGGGVVEGRLGQPLLVHAGREEQFVGNDRVVHAHAALVEDAHDRLAARSSAAICPGRCAAPSRARAAFASGCTCGVGCRHGARLEPGAQAVAGRTRR